MLLKFSTVLIAVPLKTWSYASGGILVFFGIITLFPNLWEKLSGKASNSSSKMLSSASKFSGWQRDVFVGFALGPVFNSCSPTYSLIIATVLPASQTLALFYTTVYAFGLATILFIISLLGRRFTMHLKAAADPHGWFKRTLGIIFFVVGITIIFGWEKDIEAWIIKQGYFGITEFEENLVEQIKEAE
jgi:cytochrome c biogenesis protein CcdA